MGGSGGEWGGVGGSGGEWGGVGGSGGEVGGRWGVWGASGIFDALRECFRGLDAAVS